MLNDRALDAEEVASLLHIGKKAVYNLAKAGSLPYYKIGRKMRFTVDDVERYLASTREQGARPSAPSAPGRHADPPVRIGGIGIPAGLLASQLNEAGLNAAHESIASYFALCSMYEQACDAAVIHLFDQRTNSYNVPYVQRLVPGVPVVVFRLLRRWQGFAVAKGNPKGIASWGALLRDDVRLANRARGCGSRILLDEKLLAMEAVPTLIEGYASEYPSGLTAADAVARGIADVAVVDEQVAAQAPQLDFVPLQQEWMDLVVAKRDQTLVAHAKEMLGDEPFRAEYARIIHGDAGSLGAIVYEC